MWQANISQLCHVISVLPFLPCFYPRFGDQWTNGIYDVQVTHPDAWHESMKCKLVSRCICNSYAWLLCGGSMDEVYLTIQITRKHVRTRTLHLIHRKLVMLQGSGASVCAERRTF